MKEFFEEIWLIMGVMLRIFISPFVWVVFFILSMYLLKITDGSTFVEIVSNLTFLIRWIIFIVFNFITAAIGIFISGKLNDN